MSLIYKNTWNGLFNFIINKTIISISTSNANLNLILKLSNENLIHKLSNQNLILKLSNQNLILKLSNLNLILKLSSQNIILKLFNQNLILKLSNQYPDIQFVYPVHLNPNVINVVYEKLNNISNIFLIKPLDYIEFIYLMKNSYIILTDSGGIQEEGLPPK